MEHPPTRGYAKLPKSHSITTKTNTPQIDARANADYFTSDGWASKMVSYCDTGDEVCDSGHSAEIHETYVQTYGTDATNFVVRLAQAAQENASVQNLPCRIWIGIVVACIAIVFVA